MKKIAVVYPFFRKGGAEAVAAWMLDALKDNYNVDLFTCERVSYKHLNHFYGVDLNNSSFKNISFSCLDNLFLSDRKLISKLVKRVNSLSNNYDLIISAKDELPLIGNVVSYMHCSGNIENKKSILIANSKYTAKKLKNEIVLYPPLNSNFISKSWKDKKNGFLIVGRITPQKDTHKAIQIIGEVRKKGFLVDLHIVGNISNWKYYLFVRKLAFSKKWIHFHHNISNNKLRNLIASNKYGIHCKGNEPFGIAPAEVLYSGGIPFVREKGGQVEIVGTDDLIFRNNNEAVEKIVDVLKNKKKQEKLLNHLVEQKRILSCNDFKNKFLAIIDKYIKND